MPSWELFVPLCGSLEAGGPHINPRFPLKDPDQLSPPFVHKPIHECAKAVFVSGFIPHAKVRVYVGQVELVGEAEPHFGSAEILLTRALVLGEGITATQTVNNMTSEHSYVPVVVGPIPDELKKPKVGETLYNCGRVVPVTDIVPSAHASIYADGNLIGEKEVAQPGGWHSVFTQSLATSEKVTADQMMCADTLALVSPMSDPVTVKPDPQPILAPSIVPDSLIVGNDAVQVSGLYIGAGVRIFDQGNLISSGWYAGGGTNTFPINTTLTAASLVTATQALCDVSPPSTGVTPTTSLKAPKIVGPICAGAQYVVIKDTVINANVVLYRNGQIVGYGGAVQGDLILALGGNQHLNTGDVVSALQYIGNVISPLSNTVTVSAGLSSPVVTVEGGEPFFIAEAGEQAIGAPVFPRGKGLGPQIKVQACCSKNVKAQVLGVGDVVVADVPLVEQFPGYYTGQWDWQSKSGWTVPDDIPVGLYSVKVTSDCGEPARRADFYVIFNPADVNGPGRFSFNETGIWFGTGFNNAKSLSYALHPDDGRVFKKAITAASGETDPLSAATKVSDAEEALFSYSLNYHTDDVIKMLLLFTEAQCADDANVLTAMLRSIGIPAHPATADAALETGDASWTFDTWVEFLVPTANGTEWLILHPHEYPNMSPAKRGDFGATQGVATKGFNDLVIMADEGWIAAEIGSIAVQFDRNSCDEPLQQHVFVRSWLDDLCEAGYWNPNHWDCGGSNAASSIRPEVRFDSEEASFGGPLSGRVLLPAGASPLPRELSFELLSDVAESRLFPDARYGSLVSPVVPDRSGQAYASFPVRRAPDAARRASTPHPGQRWRDHPRPGGRSRVPAGRGGPQRPGRPRPRRGGRGRGHRPQPLAARSRRSGSGAPSCRRVSSPRRQPRSLRPRSRRVAHVPVASEHPRAPGSGAAQGDHRHRQRRLEERGSGGVGVRPSVGAVAAPPEKEK